MTNLQPDTPKTVTLRNPNSTDPSSYLVRLTIKATDLDRLSGDDFNTAKPKVVELEDNKVTTLKGEVSFNGMDSNDHLLLRRNDRYTAVIVMGDSDLQRRAWIESDHAPLERIGSYSSQIPLLVAVTNSWSSLRLNFRVYEPGDFLQYRILTMSGKNIPGRELIIEAIGKHLTDLSFHDRPISGPELHTAVEWLVKSLDVHFTDEDVHETDPLQVQTLIKDLVTVTNTGSSPTASPKVEIVP